MCGIAGIVGDRAVSRIAVEAMTERMAHRGPDGTGFWHSPDGRVAFGHRRLAVIDLSPEAAQPMADAAGTAVVTYNGEIYNYRELADRLRAEGVTFRTASDTEVLLQAYLRWGDRFLDELNGMFAFALFDSRRRRLVCARDRFGEKPFLFVRGPDFLAFASEYKALLALAEVPMTVDDRRILAFLRDGRRGLDDDRATAFTAVQQLRPGEMMAVDVDTLAVEARRYWRPTPDPDLARLDWEDAAARFKDLLIDSVRLRLRSDVPMGSCLSGGLDSSAIVCIARDLIGRDRPYHVFTGRFPETEADEGRWAEDAARTVGATQHTSLPTPQDLLARLDAFMWLNELPVTSTSQYAQWCVFESARKHGVTVLLDGQGGDEILGGYEQYFADYLAALRAAGGRVRVVREEVLIRERYPLALPTLWQRLKRALPDSVRWHAARLSGRGSDFTFGLSGAARTASAILPLPRTDIDGRFHPLARALVEDACIAHLPTLLRYGDRNSMAHSREVRLPFCDHRLAEFVFSLPASYLMGEIETKRLLRRAMAGILPESVGRRWNKRGFLPPQEAWFKECLAARVEAVFHDPAFTRRGHWNVVWWRRALDRFRNGESHLAWTLWKPFIAETWWTGFVDRLRAMPRYSVFDPNA
jgi:asparagine synthase (glutamine-hydrolysing)